jgi:hypothetical protein
MRGIRSWPMLAGSAVSRHLLAQWESGVQIPSPPAHRDRRSGRMELPVPASWSRLQAARVPSVFHQGLPAVLAVSFVIG